MSLNKLKVISSAPPRYRAPPTQNSRHATIAKWERAWNLHPEKFDPYQKVLRENRFERTWKMVNRFVALEGAEVVDLGCGSGELCQRMAEQGARVLALDAATNALKRLPPSIQTRQEVLPQTQLPDDQYSLVLCADVIGEMDPKQARHLIAEIYRLLAPKGKAVISSSIDIYSKDAYGAFIRLLRTELEIIDLLPSYHKLYILTRDLLRKMGKFGTPLLSRVEKSPRLLQGLEKISHFFLQEKGITHVAVVAKRRQAFF